ncbi:hypothetical protein [Paraflavitalea sp. CAU 1676]|uniref:hypothetical protein n=1 Tax=Paraflavitalea sp. CAU 1676 TaxID=3032598 RepID=UPI0023DC8262|nr:hypothetical protein [Paraflavitalea sp. CAU 1676]MDF2188683.1 hypothetical protein [Paraflavitalea sp. CAU 1676]
MSLQLYVPYDMALPDNDQWQFRFQIESATSDRIYIISQNKKRRHWACSCPGYKRHRHCKHLSAVGLPGKEQPFEVNLIKT